MHCGKFAAHVVVAAGVKHDLYSRDPTLRHCRPTEQAFHTLARRRPAAAAGDDFSIGDDEDGCRSHAARCVLDPVPSAGDVVVVYGSVLGGGVSYESTVGTRDENCMRADVGY